MSAERKDKKQQPSEGADDTIIPDLIVLGGGIAAIIAGTLNKDSGMAQAGHLAATVSVVDIGRKEIAKSLKL